MPTSIFVEFRKAGAERHFQGAGSCQIARLKIPVLN
jgi:hypothetical protein